MSMVPPGVNSNLTLTLDLLYRKAHHMILNSYGSEKLLRDSVGKRDSFECANDCDLDLTGEGHFFGDLLGDLAG